MITIENHESNGLYVFLVNNNKLNIIFNVVKFSLKYCSWIKLHLINNFLRQKNLIV